MFYDCLENKAVRQGNIVTILRTICAKLKFINFLDMDDHQNTFKYHCSVMVLYFKRDIKIRVDLNNASLDSAENAESFMRSS